VESRRCSLGVLSELRPFLVDDGPLAFQVSVSRFKFLGFSFLADRFLSLVLVRSWSRSLGLSVHAIDRLSLGLSS
jgi:hypothetical protein